MGKTPIVLCGKVNDPCAEFGRNQLKAPCFARSFVSGRCFGVTEVGEVDCLVNNVDLRESVALEYVSVDLTAASYHNLLTTTQVQVSNTTKLKHQQLTKP